MGKVIVCGAGISGLGTAYWLRRLGHDVTVFERADRPGGVIQTVRQDGYLFEKGPNSFLDNTPEVLELCEGVGIENRMLKQSMRGNKRYLYRNGELHEVPTGPGALIKTPLLSGRAKRGLLFEALRTANRKPQDESCAAFVRRRLGDEIYQYLFTPFVSGVYAADPEHLSLQASFPMLYELERGHGSLTKGMIGKMLRRKKEPAKPRAKNICSFIDGMQTLPQALGGSLQDRLHLNTRVNRIHPQDNGFRVESSRLQAVCDALVVTTPADVTAQLLAPIFPATAAYFQTLPYNRLAVLGLGVKREQVQHPCDGFGFLAPRNQGVRILGSIWGSSLFANRAPGGERAFSVFLGGGLDLDAMDLSDEELLQTSLRDLADCIGLRGDPVVEHVFRWQRAIPQYPIGHVQKLQDLKREWETIPSLFLTGNFIRGISVNECIANGKKTAERVHHYLKARG